MTKSYSIAEQLRNEYAVDARTLSDLWDEEPVPLDVFVKDKKYLANPDLFPFQYELVREVEQIFLPETYIAMVEEFGAYWAPRPMRNFIYAEVGKGGGKDHACRISSARVAYLLSCLRDPQSYFGFAPQDEIHTINVATTAPQARRAFFKPLGTLLKNSPWFARRLRSEITDMATSIRLDKQLEMVSGHSLAESFEGLNPILAIADEIAAFRAEQEHLIRGVRDSTRSAEAIMKVLRSSARSRFPVTFKMVAISYPRHIGDPIETLVARGKRDIKEKGADKSRYHVIGPMATWDANPRTKGPEDYEEDYDEDPERAKATYECLPQRSPNRFFRNNVAIAEAFKPLAEDAHPPLEISHWWGIDPEMEVPGDEPPPLAWQADHVLHGILPMSGCLYALHADLAVSGDRAGIAMAHVRTWVHQADDYKHADDRPIVRVDFITNYEADLTAITPDGELSAREIQLRWFRRLVWELSARGFPIGLVTFDGWESLDSIQIIESWGIEAKKQSIDRTPMPYQTLRDVVYDGRLEAYDDGIVVKELEGLTKLANGKIDHPADGSKDESDALAGAVLGALFLGGDEGEMPEVIEPATITDLGVNGFGDVALDKMDLGLASSWDAMKF